MKNIRTASLIAALLGVVLLTAGAEAFTTAESQRTVEVYSDDNPGTFVDFEVIERDETACALTFEVTNNVPAPGQTIELDRVVASGNGFGAHISSFSIEPMGVGESTEVRVRIQDGYVGRGTVRIDAEMSGEDIEIEMEEETWVRCVDPEDDKEGGGGKPVTPPGRR